MEKKLISRIFGGLGNQLFCYAAARRLALVNNAELVIDDVSGFYYDYDFQRHCQFDHFNISSRKATVVERMEPLSRVRRYLKRRWNRFLPYQNRSYLVQESLEFDPRLLEVKLNGTVYIEGYWQSEGYFKDIENIIRKDLQITPPTDLDNLTMHNRITSCSSVAVHVRFFDAPHRAGNSNASSDYYSRAIQTMERLAPGSHYFLFSDQPSAARSRIDLPDSRVTIVTHNIGDKNAYADLWLIASCNNFIIANSTFSWWGAWLSEFPTKYVIAPNDSFTNSQSAWGFAGLLPDEWIKL